MDQNKQRNDEGSMNEINTFIEIYNDEIYDKNEIKIFFLFIKI